MRGDRLGAMLLSASGAGGGTAESTQVDRAEGSKRERAEGPKRGRSAPVLSSYRREASSGGKWPGAGRRGKLTEPKGPAAKQGGQGEANGQLLGLWLHDLCLAAGNLTLLGVPRNALLCS